jgi:hypothetical protein
LSTPSQTKLSCEQTFLRTNFPVANPTIVSYLYRQRCKNLQVGKQPSAFGKNIYF